MYKHYLHKYFLNYSITIDQAMINFLKHWSHDHSNTSVILPATELLKSFHQHSEEFHVKIGLCCGFSACPVKNIINKIQFYS
jgi:hypothetical protein